MYYSFGVSIVARLKRLSPYLPPLGFSFVVLADAFHITTLQSNADNRRKCLCRKTSVTSCPDMHDAQKGKRKNRQLCSIGQLDLLCPRNSSQNIAKISNELHDNYMAEDVLSNLAIITDALVGCGAADAA